MDKFESNTIETLVKRYQDVFPQKWTPRLARSHTMVQTPISGSACTNRGTANITQAHEERERAQTEFMQLELTLVEHE